MKKNKTIKTWQIIVLFFVGGAIGGELFGALGYITLGIGFPYLYYRYKNKR